MAQEMATLREQLHVESEASRSHEQRAAELAAEQELSTGRHQDAVAA
eukprot:COSAG01_NODE_77180_length_169_cov_44.514286_1_plen_46_part_01